MTTPSVRVKDGEAAADAIIDAVGKTIVLGLPLGLGKACHIANALYERAAADRAMDLRIFTALTLSRPSFGSDLERRFMEPVIERAFGGYPAFAWLDALRDDALPPNVEINEFFLQAGMWTRAPAVQRNYIAANYTHATRYILDRGVNVVAQLVGDDGDKLNLSCNTDLTLELLQARRGGCADFVLAGQVNGELPIMPGEAEIPLSEFGVVLDSPETRFPLPGPPKTPVSLEEHARGLHIASLIPDGGTLEIGIGSLSHAVCHALILRHRRPAAFRDLLGRLTPVDDQIPRHTEPFSEGLYACTEMFVDGFLELWRAGVLRREVHGAVLDAAFFLGPKDFYAALRDLPETDRARFRMTSVGRVNELHGPDFSERVAARKQARFVNNAMIATLLGAVTSDGLEDGSVVSGVGGQYNFVAQAFALPDARSIMTLPATRGGAKPESNIRYAYGHTTVPRHLRDIVVTEYGVADLRGAPDHAVVERMLGIADARFQAKLLAQARKAGKVADGCRYSESWARNTPQHLDASLKDASDLLPSFPFGSDFSKTELRLLPALKRLKTAGRLDLACLAARGVLSGPLDQDIVERLNLGGIRKLPHRRLISGALKRQ